MHRSLNRSLYALAHPRRINTDEHCSLMYVTYIEAVRLLLDLFECIQDHNYFSFAYLSFYYY